MNAPTQGDTRATICKTASDMQELASRVICLVRAIDGLAENIHDDPVTKGQSEAANAQIVFARMAEEAAVKLRDISEGLELTARTI